MATLSPKILYKKHIQGAALSAKEKQIIMNVYSFFRHYCANDTIKKVVDVTASACGVSERIVFQCKKRDEGGSRRSDK